MAAQLAMLEKAVVDSSVAIAEFALTLDVTPLRQGVASPVMHGGQAAQPAYTSPSERGCLTTKGKPAETCSGVAE